MSKQRKRSKRAGHAKRKHVKRRQKGGYNENYERSKKSIQIIFNTVAPFVRQAAEQYKKNNPQYFQ